MLGRPVVGLWVAFGSCPVLPERARLIKLLLVSALLRQLGGCCRRVRRVRRRRIRQGFRLGLLCFLGSGCGCHRCGRGHYLAGHLPPGTRGGGRWRSSRRTQEEEQLVRGLSRLGVCHLRYVITKRGKVSTVQHGPRARNMHSVTRMPAAGWHTLESRTSRQSASAASSFPVA